MTATTLYDQLASMTVIVADTGDINSIEQFKPRDATTNPSLITSAANMPEYAEVGDSAPSSAPRRRSTATSRRSSPAPSIVSPSSSASASSPPSRAASRTEVDARLSYDTEGSVAKARELIGFYAEEGIDRERVLIKIASTWEGIRAAEVLEKEGIHCNLTLLFGFAQAVACAEAKVTLISPFVGRIYDWYKKDTGRDSYPPAEDPGVRL